MRERREEGERERERERERAKEVIINEDKKYLFMTKLEQSFVILVQYSSTLQAFPVITRTNLVIRLSLSSN